MCQPGRAPEFKDDSDDSEIWSSGRRAYGKVHAKAVSGNADARLVAVGMPFRPPREAIAGAYGCEGPDDRCDRGRGDIDAVVICTPTDTHADLIERFARAGKAIFCEKPIDLDVERVRGCLKVVSETKAKLMVGFNRRFDPHFMAVRKAIDDGRIGEVEMVTITSRDPVRRRSTTSSVRAGSSGT